MSKRHQYTHNAPNDDFEALVAKIRAVDGTKYDCTILVWEACITLVKGIDDLKRRAEQ